MYSKDRDEGEANKSESEFDEKLQAKCHTLLNILDKMSEAVKGIEAVYEKSTGFEQLCDISANMSKSVNISPVKKVADVLGL